MVLQRICCEDITSINCDTESVPYDWAASEDTQKASIDCFVCHSDWTVTCIDRSDHLIVVFSDVRRIIRSIRFDCLWPLSSLGA